MWKIFCGNSPSGVHTELKGNYKFPNNKIVWDFDIGKCHENGSINSVIFMYKIKNFSNILADVLTF